MYIIYIYIYIYIYIHAHTHTHTHTHTYIHIHIYTRIYAVKEIAGDMRCYLLPKLNPVVPQLLICRAIFMHKLFHIQVIY